MPRPQIINRFPYYAQMDAMDCGPCCLRMIAEHYGKRYTLQTLRNKSFIGRQGVSLLGISEAAESIGMRTLGVSLDFAILAREAPLPCIVHWRQHHFVVVYKIQPGQVYVADPAHGLITYTEQEFKAAWLSTKQDGVEKGICLLLEPTPDFYAAAGEKLAKTGFKFVFAYFKPYYRFFFQLALGMGIGSLLQLVFPFLTQAVVDYGINRHDLGFLYLVALAQLVLLVSRTSVDFIRDWILLHISTRINMSLISDFLIKLMKLPIRFFDIKMLGDIMQRITDHDRIESFLTRSTLSIIFALINLVVFSVVLGIYNLAILAVFYLGSILHVVWVVAFMKRRRDLDFKRFAQMSQNRNTLFQLITGMQEIKLNNCEKQKRWDWERIQARLFKLSLAGLSLDQWQNAGAVGVTEFRNILVTFLSATAVMDGHMTLGMMLAVQYIIGQLSGPISQLINFMHAVQDTKISLERLGEIHNTSDEEMPSAQLVTRLPAERAIRLEGVSFQYEGPQSEWVLNNLDLEIMANRITAIVGVSGSGKTTLIKMLLGFYPPVAGRVRVGPATDLFAIAPRVWRQACGAVMQDGFIFSDTIAGNITISDEIPDLARLCQAAQAANIHEFIDSLPLKYNTKIGADGHGLSQGQKQRILIARAIYKNGDYLFFDEATNALDAENERLIVNNLAAIFQGRTVVVVAHRLSTVKHADRIVVLAKGQITEQGTHAELVQRQGAYYNLVKNQLELGK